MIGVRWKVWRSCDDPNSTKVLKVQSMYPFGGIYDAGLRKQPVHKKFYKKYPKTTRYNWFSNACKAGVSGQNSKQCIKINYLTAE